MSGPLDKVNKDLERLRSKTYRDATPVIFGQAYYYAYGFKEVKNYKGQLVTKLFTDGPFASKREAELKLLELGLDQGDVHESSSRDLKKVKKEVAAVLAHEHQLPIEVATQRKYRSD